MTSGTRKLSKEQYLSIRTFVDSITSFQNTAWKLDLFRADQVTGAGTNVRSLPHYTTLLKRFKPLLLNSLAPLGHNHMLPVDTAKAGARFECIDNDRAVAQTSVRIILPSEYARMDMATPAVWERMRSTSLSHNRDCASFSHCVDVWPLVAARKWFYGHQKAISADMDALNGGYCFAEHGDTLDLLIMDREELTESLRRSFEIESSDQSQITLRGVVSHSWTVHHEKRIEDESFEKNSTTKLSRGTINFIPVKCFELLFPY